MEKLLYPEEADFIKEISCPKHYPKILISTGKYYKTLIVIVSVNFFFIKGLKINLNVVDDDFSKY